MESTNWKRLIVVPLIIAAIFAGGITFGKYLSRRALSGGNASAAPLSPRLEGDKLGQVLSLIYAHYVDEPRMDSIQEVVIPMVLRSLDPHSDYIPASEIDGVNESIEGQFEGIGITFNMFNDTVRVASVISGGPSQQAGLLTGDRILTVDGDTIAGKKVPQDSVVKRLRGPRGTQVALGVQRSHVAGLLPIEVIRDVIPVKSVDAGLMVDNGVGYICLTVFSRNSHQEIVRIAEHMKTAGMTKLILDLRGNSGGLLDQAIRIANEFLPGDALIVYTEGRAMRRREQRADGRGRLQDVEVVVLINEYSASASEIVAGALQDNDRGTIIGRRSFGKGLVQEQVDMGDGSAVRLTVSRYYTPVGRSIQKPYDNGLEAYDRDLQARFDHSEFFSADSIRFADSLRYTTPGGRVVYGGGGIMPDVFVPVDTTKHYSPYAIQVLNRNIVFQYTVAYADRHRQALGEINNLRQLMDYFEGEPQLYDDFVRYAASRGVSPKGTEKEDARKLLTANLKALIGRNTPMEDNAYYYYLLPAEDDIFNRAMGYLKDN